MIKVCPVCESEFQSDDPDCICIPAQEGYGEVLRCAKCVTREVIPVISQDATHRGKDAPFLYEHIH